MYYEQILAEIDNFKDFCKRKIEEDKNNLNAPEEIMLRKHTEALGETGRNLNNVLQIFDFGELVAEIRRLETIGDYSKFEIGDYIVIPQFVFNGKTYYNWRFDLMGIGTYDFRKDETVPGLLFTSHRTCFVTIWPGDTANKSDFNNFVNNLELQMRGMNLRSIHHYYGQARQSEWIDNKCCLLGEQEMGNPQNTFTFNNSHSCALLPLVRRSPVSRIKDSTPNTRNTWWLASRDAYQDDASKHNSNCVIAMGYGKESFGLMDNVDISYTTSTYSVVPSIYI